MENTLSIITGGETRKFDRKTIQGFEYKKLEGKLSIFTKEGDKNFIDDLIIEAWKGKEFPLARLYECDSVVISANGQVGFMQEGDKELTMQDLK